MIIFNLERSTHVIAKQQPFRTTFKSEQLCMYITWSSIILHRVHTHMHTPTREEKPGEPAFNDEFLTIRQTDRQAKQCGKYDKDLAPTAAVVSRPGYKLKPNHSFSINICYSTSHSPWKNKHPTQPEKQTRCIIIPNPINMQHPFGLSSPPLSSPSPFFAVWVYSMRSAACKFMQGPAAR